MYTYYIVNYSRSEFAQFTILGVMRTPLDSLCASLGWDMAEHVQLELGGSLPLAAREFTPLNSQN
jgi:hypothetical protein